MYLDQSK